jgi:hypothetical protein
VKCVSCIELFVLSLKPKDGLIFGQETLLTEKSSREFNTLVSFLLMKEIEERSVRAIFCYFSFCFFDWCVFLFVVEDWS